MGSNDLPGCLSSGKRRPAPTNGCLRIAHSECFNLLVCNGGSQALCVRISEAVTIWPGLRRGSGKSVRRVEGSVSELSTHRELIVSAATMFALRRASGGDLINLLLRCATHVACRKGLKKGGEMT
jgi:hypothetical protein